MKKVALIDAGQEIYGQSIGVLVASFSTIREAADYNEEYQRTAVGGYVPTKVVTLKRWLPDGTHVRQADLAESK